MAGHSHRSSVKKGHKTFKSKHASKGALKRLHKGKVEQETAAGVKGVRVVRKQDRKNAAKQLRQQKISSTSQLRRLFEGANGAAKIVAVIPLTPDVDAGDIVQRLVQGCDEDVSGMQTPCVRDFRIGKFRSTLKVIVPDMGSFLSIMDAAKVADYVVLGLSGTSEVDPVFGEQVIRVLELQGIASYMGVVSNLSKVHPKEKFQLDVKQSLESYFRHFFPTEDRIYNLEKASDSLNAQRILCQQYPRGVSWRDSRGYLVAGSVDYVESGPDAGELVVDGTVRGVGLHPNRLVHLPGLGDFQVSAIEKIAASSRSSEDNGEGSGVFLPDAQQDTLEEFAPHDLDMEEWDDNQFEYDNLTSARYDDHGFLPGREQSLERAKVPKGTSEYQARWYVDNVVDVSDDDAEDEMELEMGSNEVGTVADDTMMDAEDAQSDDASEADMATMVDEMFVDLSPEEEERQLQEYRAMEKDDLEFPDEIELDPSESAIERLKRYRGLKNLHNCVWNVDEQDPHCPSEWKRMLRIGSYKNLKARTNKSVAAEASVVAGDKVRLRIRFPKHLLERLKDPRIAPFVVYGLLPHEHKQVVANLSIQRWEEFEDPVPSGESLIVQYGVRRYTIQPQFSSASNVPNNVHRFERFLHHNSASIATCMLPLDLTQSPAIYFKENPSDPKGLTFVGHGTFLNADHTRILAKRIILTGHPFKFHKRVVTVRYMFFRPEDVEWFKSIPLFTKSGRSGFIKESLGTHGYFKATFDGRLSAQDTVAMSLFRRVWPKTSLPWFY